MYTSTFIASKVLFDEFLTLHIYVILYVTKLGIYREEISISIGLYPSAGV